MRSFAIIEDMDREAIDQLIKAATDLINKYTDDKNHTVAAAVLTKSGKVFTPLNLYHFTGCGSGDTNSRGLRRRVSHYDSSRRT